MNPLRLSVSQVRVAAACPRIAYFDAYHTRANKLAAPSVTRLWKAGESDTTALGSLFHRSIERFNRQAPKDEQLYKILNQAEGSVQLAQELSGLVYNHYVKHDQLFQAEAPQQAAFIQALHTYLNELADIINYARSQNMEIREIIEQMFGDSRRRVDVTFRVGAHDQGVNIVGILDYVFYDYRSERKRIIDYKLTPSKHPKTDLFQVSLYALMHHIQHQTEPDVGLLYLHPKREMCEKPWENIYADRHGMYDFLASLEQWLQYDEHAQTGLKPPGEPLYCDRCRWRKECTTRLGPKHQGDRLNHWTQTNHQVEEPSLSPHNPPEVVPEPEPEEEVSESVSTDAQTESSTKPNSDSAMIQNQTQLWIGHWENDQEPTSIPLTALPTHLTVVGAAGSGKTWLAKVIVEEAIRHRVPVIAIDPQGDLVQFLRRRKKPEVKPAYHQAYDQFNERVEPRIYTPGTSHGIRIALNPTRTAKVDDLAGIEDQTRRQEEQQGMLNTVASNLVSLAKVGGEEDSQRTFLYRVLQGLLVGDKMELELSQVVSGIYAPESLGIEQPELMIKKTEREKLARKLNNLIEGPSARLFQGGKPLDLAELCRPAEPGKVPLNVIYLNAMTDDDQKQFFVASLAAEVYRWMVTGVTASGGKPSLLFYLDEARDYIPAVGNPPAKQPMIRLFTQGRKYGVSCLLCTQSPRSVDYNVFGNCSTKIIGRMESAQDLERISDWFTTSGAAPNWIKDRKGAAKGTFVARWPEMPPQREGQVLRSRDLFSLHEGAWSPDHLEMMVRKASS